MLTSLWLLLELELSDDGVLAVETSLCVLEVDAELSVVSSLCVLGLLGVEAVDKSLCELELLTVLASLWVVGEDPLVGLLEVLRSLTLEALVASLCVLGLLVDDVLLLPDELLLLELRPLTVRQAPSASKYASHAVSPTWLRRPMSVNRMRRVNAGMSGVKLRSTQVESRPVSQPLSNEPRRLSSAP